MIIERRRERIDFVATILLVRGYPIDKRSADQRARDESSVLGDVERMAGRVVARLTGETVTPASTAASTPHGPATAADRHRRSAQ